MLWWYVAAVTLATLGVVAIVAVNRPTERVTPPPQPLPQAASPAVTAEPTPRPPPGESALHSMVIPDAGACPEFAVRRGGVPSAELEGYLSSILDCLLAANTPGFTRAGFALTRPALAPDSAVGGSGCLSGTDQPQNWVGLYCPQNTTIYYRAEWNPGDPVEYLDVLVHEFAHHVQHEAGILDQVSVEQVKARRQVNGEILAQELSRRLELHAECLTGVMVGPRGPMALRSRELKHLVELRSSVPPEWAATHGTGRAQTHWFEQGAQAGAADRYARCNTFTAPTDTVE